MMDRNSAKAELIEKNLLKEFPNGKIERIKIDLENISSVKSACEQLKCHKFQYLILNAGAYSIPRNNADSGYDSIFQINFISHYYIAKQMLPVLSHTGGKIIAVGSIAHRFSKTDTADIDFKKRRMPSAVYGNSKRFLIYSLSGLIKRNPDVQLSVVHPGITFTNITSHYPKLILSLIKRPMKLIFISPSKAALNIIKGIFTKTEENQWIGPGYFDIWGFPKVKRLYGCKGDEYSFIFDTAEEIYSEICKSSNNALNRH